MDTNCENCGGKSGQRQQCPHCGRLVCRVCRIILEDKDFCDHGNIPYWKIIPLTKEIKDSLWKDGRNK